jgi:hypothetical protein
MNRGFTGTYVFSGQTCRGLFCPDMFQKHLYKKQTSSECRGGVGWNVNDLRR